MPRRRIERREAEAAAPPAQGDAWNLARFQRVDEVIRTISRIAFGKLEDPYGQMREGRRQNARYAVGKRVAEYPGGPGPR